MRPRSPNPTHIPSALPVPAALHPNSPAKNLHPVTVIPGFQKDDPMTTDIRKNSCNDRGSLFAALLVLLLAAAPAPVSAQTTADQVKDRESLKAFVLDAKRYIESITDYNELVGIRATLQERRKWVSGETYLMLAQANGSVPFHAGDRSAESKNILAMRDDRGVEVVRKMIDVADNGGGFVDYVDGELKTSYAVKLLTGVGNITFYLIGGYSQDLSSAPPATVDLPKPAVTAAEVVDKETLVVFVEAAAAAYRRAYESKAQGDVMAVRNAFREEGGHWRAGSVYLWIVGSAGITLLHATEQYREGKPTDMERVDANGLPFPKLLIGGALREGRKFLHYYYDNPEIQGDEDTGSPKFGYAVSFNAPNSDQKLVIGSGIYPQAAE